MIGAVNYNSTGNNLTFKVADCALCVSWCSTGDVVRTLGEFTHDGANAAVVLNETSTCVSGDIVAYNA